VAVRARVGEKIFDGRYGLARQDVRQAFGEPGSEASGFEIPLSLPYKAVNCQLEARSHTGAWEVFMDLSLSPPASSALRERWRWLRFWLLAWCGSPKAWALLTESEQDHMAAWAAQQGLSTLDRFAQHPPHPVEEERFPRSRRKPEALPKFTIATPSYNQAAFVQATMRSVLEQRGVRIDYIVQDGASTDGSREHIAALAEAYANHEAPTRVIQWQSEPDKGQADAIRRAFRHTDCGPDDIMGYLNSDDLLMPGALAYVADYFARHPEVDVVYGHRVNIDESGFEIGRWITPRLRCDDLRLHDLIPQETLFWRKRIWDKVDGMDPTFQFAMDWDLIMRFREAGARFKRLPRFLGLFRVHPRQKTQSWIGDIGLREMDKIRTHALGRPAQPREADLSMKRALFDSALVYALLIRGIRL
jgi:GT2 family glycosyltransferase